MRFVLVGLVGLLVLTLAWHNVFTVDVWTHLAAGRWIVTHHTVPTTDPFSYTLPAGQRWVDHEWLFQLVLYPIYLLGGIDGIIALRIAVVLVTFTVLWLTIHDRRTYLTTAALVTLAAMSSYTRFTERPEIVSCLFLAVTLLVMERYRKNRNIRWLYVLPVMSVLWVNVHGLFILGPIVVTLFLAGETLQRLRGPWPWVIVAAVYVTALFTVTDMLWEEVMLWTVPVAALIATAVLMTMKGICPDWSALTTVKRGDTRRWLVVLGLCIVAALVNPYFLRGAMYPLEMAGQMVGRTQGGLASIGELAPTLSFTNVAQTWWFKALLAVVAASFVLNFRRTRFSRVLLPAVSLPVALGTLRGVPVFALVGTYCAGLNLHEWWQANRERVLNRLKSERVLQVAGVTGAALWVVVVLAVTVDVAGDRMYVWDRTGMRFGGGLHEGKFSTRAMQFVKQNRLRGPMFNNFGIGGMCMFHLYPEHKVFIDGRAELYGEQRLREYGLVLTRPEEFDRMQSTQGRDFNLVVMTTWNRESETLAKKLIRDRAWHMVYNDEACHVLVRDIPAHRAVIEANAGKYDFAAMERELPEGKVVLSREAGPPRLYDRIRAVVRALPERRRSPAGAVTDAMTMLELGYPKLAQAKLHGLVQLDPEVPDVHFGLAVLHQVRLYDLKTKALPRATAEDRARIEAQIAELFQQTVNEYREVERLQPEFPGLYASMATFYVNLGRNEDGRRAMGEALARDYPTASELTKLGDLAMQIGDFAWARELYHKALRRSPGNRKIQSRLTEARLAEQPQH